jgi:GAF domain-containing protein
VETNDVVQLSQDFAQLGRELHGDGDNQAALQRMVQLAVKYIEPCAGASITLIRGATGHSLASSDAVASRADALQYELDEGPCLRSAERDEDYRLFDVTDEARWPHFCAALLEHTPYRCMLSFHLAAQDAGALNLFAEQPGAFSDGDVDLATVFAAQATSLVALHESEDNAAHLQAALNNSREIGTAIGVLMAHHKVTQDTAFALLRQASQTLHIKLRDVAAEVVITGMLPDPE